MNGHHDPTEEILEQAWNLAERGPAVLPELLARLPEVPAAPEAVAGLAEAGLLAVTGEQVALTPRGEAQARRVVRANRLAARLLADILEWPPEQVELHACRLEHAISPELADRLCTFLGHPPVAPDGRPIPPGPCCAERLGQTASAVCALPALGLGRAGRVTFIRHDDAETVRQLSALGLNPGVSVRLRQRHPAVVVELGESTLALDDAIAAAIHVKPA